VGWVLRTGRVSVFARQLALPRPGLRSEDLNGLAADIRAALTGGEANRRGGAAESPRAAAARDGRLPRADAPHCRAEPATLAVADAGGVDPSVELGERFPRLQAALQNVEDAIFEVLAGKNSELPRLRQQWRDALAAVGPREAGELRERFLRHAIALWRQLGNDDPQRQYLRAAQALDVICLIVEGTSA